MTNIISKCLNHITREMIIEFKINISIKIKTSLKITNKFLIMTLLLYVKDVINKTFQWNSENVCPVTIKYSNSYNLLNKWIIKISKSLLLKTIRKNMKCANIVDNIQGLS